MRFVSLMADSSAPFYAAVMEYLAEQTGVTMNVVTGVDWLERERLLDNGEAEIGVVCGFQYIRKHDSEGKGIDVLAAPVMAGERYQGRPIYFSDVVVSAGSTRKNFGDLRGASWAYNEPSSHSGCNVVRFHLAAIGEDSSYFGEIVESGAHQDSLRLIVEGKIEATAIDSTVLEIELRRRPSLATLIRVIDTFGPSPHPPMVILDSISASVKHGILKCLTRMHENRRGKDILEEGMVQCFVGVTDSDYDPIRRMTEAAGRSHFPNGS